MDKEISLQKKINLLQAQMMEFSKRISPVKKEVEENNLSNELSSSYDFQAACLQIITTIVKTFICFVGPILFPTMVYCIEGSSLLFWQVMVISTFIVFVLVTMAFTELQIFIGHVKASFYQLINICFKQKIKIIEENKFPAVNMHVLMFLIAATLLSIFAYRKSILIVFYVCLVSAGFLLGILTMQMYEHFKNDDKLPQYSPCNIKFNLIKASPTSKSKTGLSLTEEKKEHSSILEQSSRHLTSQRRLDFSDVRFTLRPPIPNTPPPSYQEAIDGPQSQPMLNLNYFFRTP